MIGEQSITTGTEYENTLFGGISGIDYDVDKNKYFAISDDRSEKNDARFYELDLDIDYYNFNSVTINNVTTILEPDGTPFGVKEVDPEGIRLNTTDETLYWVSEIDKNGNPLIRIMNINGAYLSDVSIPTKYLKNSDGSSGVRSGQSFESISFSPSFEKLFIAIENPLVQDGERPTSLSSAPVRILKFDVSTGILEAEFSYNVEAIPLISNGVPALSDNGLSEILAVDDYTLITVERAGRHINNFNFEFTAKAYLVDLRNATNINNIDSLIAADKSSIQASSKKLLIDFEDVTDKVDNIEAVSFGPTIYGKRTLVFASDNNFNATQKSQFLAFREKWRYSLTDICD